MRTWSDFEWGHTGWTSTVHGSRDESLAPYLGLVELGMADIFWDTTDETDLIDELRYLTEHPR